MAVPICPGKLLIMPTSDLEPSILVAAQKTHRKIERRNILPRRTGILFPEK